MNGGLASGLLMIVGATAYFVSILWRKGERFEYAFALFMAELGLMNVVGYMMPPTRLGLVVTMTFFISALVTFVFWWKLFREYNRRTNG